MAAVGSVEESGSAGELDVSADNRMELTNANLQNAMFDRAFAFESGNLIRGGDQPLDVLWAKNKVLVKANGMSGLLHQSSTAPLTLCSATDLGKSAFLCDRRTLRIDRSGSTESVATTAGGESSEPSSPSRPVTPRPAPPSTATADDPLFDPRGDSEDSGLGPSPAKSLVHPSSSPSVSPLPCFEDGHSDSLLDLSPRTDDSATSPQQPEDDEFHFKPIEDSSFQFLLTDPAPPSDFRSFAVSKVSTPLHQPLVSKSCGQTYKDSSKTCASSYPKCRKESFVRDRSGSDSSSGSASLSSFPRKRPASNVGRNPAAIATSSAFKTNRADFHLNLSGLSDVKLSSFMSSPLFNPKVVLVDAFIDRLRAPVDDNFIVKGRRSSVDQELLNLRQCATVDQSLVKPRRNSADQSLGRGRRNSVDQSSERRTTSVDHTSSLDSSSVHQSSDFQSLVDSRQCISDDHQRHSAADSRLQSPVDIQSDDFQTVTSNRCRPIDDKSSDFQLVVDSRRRSPADQQSSEFQSVASNRCRPADHHQSSDFKTVASNPCKPADHQSSDFQSVIERPSSDFRTLVEQQSFDVEESSSSHLASDCGTTSSSHCSQGAPPEEDGACKWADCHRSADDNATETDLIDHIRQCHVTSQRDENKSFVCLWAGCKVYDKPSCSRAWLERHVLLHGGSKPFRCIVDGCRQRFGSESILQRHVNSHFHHRLHPSRAALRRRNRHKNRRKPLSMKSKDFFDDGIMEHVRHNLLQLSCIEGMVTGGPPAAITFQSTIIGKRVDNTGKVKVLLHWNPEDMIPDSWVLEDEVSSNFEKTIPVSWLPPEKLKQMDSLYTSQLLPRPGKRKRK